ncbi:uncharacterized protein JCM10292_001417 [Rhodotorula paludigena]|uniref:uncharacterized protein n=1 Tax=Rhodotorula paludigena TaxID=86838 RepID=UPI00316B69C2
MAPQLPPELVLACLQQLDPADIQTIPTLVAAAQVSTSFAALAKAAVLWRPVADAQYHQHRPPSDRAAFEADAFAYTASRRRKDLRARSLVRELQRPYNRLELVDKLRQLGSDVIENRLWAPSEFSEDKRPQSWLSLRHWANEARRTLLRDEAIELWRAIAERDARGEEADDDFERGLDAFAAFRGIDPTLLPRERYDVYRHHQELVEATKTLPFQGAQQLEYLANEVHEHMKRLRLGPALDGTFHNLDNHYVEIVWSRAELHREGENEGTLPMTLVAIFCSLVRRLPIARELGIRARPIGFPGTVLAGLAFDGSSEWTYCNVFKGTTIVRPAALREMLAAVGQPALPEFLEPASAKAMCLRVARNILTSIRSGDQSIGVPIGHSVATSALYSVAHALFVFSSPPSSGGAPQPFERGVQDQYAGWLRSLVQSEFPLDVSHLERAVAPALSGALARETRDLCAAIRADDQGPREQKLVSARIRWRIGHVFEHRLFEYRAVIRGWDYRCEASEEWIQQMRVDSLPFGRAQPFYHVLVLNDGSSRYVAHENVTDFAFADEDAVVERALKIDGIGKWFRRRERAENGRWVFVPSEEVEAEYPDS